MLNHDSGGSPSAVPATSTRPPPAQRVPAPHPQAAVRIDEGARDLREFRCVPQLRGREDRADVDAVPARRRGQQVPFLHEQDPFIARLRELSPGIDRDRLALEQDGDQPAVLDVEQIVECGRPQARGPTAVHRDDETLPHAFRDAKAAEFRAVEAEQAVFRADPQIAGGILGEGDHGQVAEPLGLAIGLQRQLLAGRARAQEGERQCGETMEKLEVHDDGRVPGITKNCVRVTFIGRLVLTFPTFSMLQRNAANCRMFSIYRIQLCCYSSQP
jgi:hypothetical protein